MNKPCRQISAERYDNLVIVVLLFAVMLIPVLILRAKLDAMAQKEMKLRQVETTSALHEEMEHFKDDLTADLHLQRLLQNTFVELSSRKAFSRVNSNVDPSLVRSGLQELIGQVQARLLHLGYPQPLFVVATDKNLRQFSFSFSEEFLTAKSNPSLAAEFIGKYSLLSNLELLPSQLLSDLGSSFMNHSPDAARLAGYEDLQKKFFSSYKPKILPHGVVSQIFSDLYDFQNILFYSQIYKEQSTFNGLIAVGYLETSFSEPLMLQKSLCSMRNKALRRFIKESGLGKSRKRILGVELQHPESLKFASNQRFISFVSGMLMLFGYAMLLHSCLFKVKLPFPLRNKLMLILALALFIPGLLVAIVMRGIVGFAESSRADLAQNELTTSLDLTELYYQEIVNRQVLNNLHFKLAMTNLLQQKTLQEIDLSVFSGYLSSNILRSSIYDRDGRFFCTENVLKKDKPNRLTQNSLVRFFNNVGGLRENAVTRKHVDELAFTDGFTDGLLKTDFFLNEAGKEAENVPSAQNMSPYSRDHFYFFPDLSAANFSPKAIGFFGISPDAQFEKYVVSRSDYPMGFFSKQEDGYQRNFAMARCSSEKIESEFLLDPSLRKPEFLQPLMHRARQSMSSGSSIGEHAGQLTSWRSFDSWPFVFVGSIELNADSFAMFYLETFPYVLLVFAMLMLIVLSTILSRLFLTPLSAVVHGIKTIAEEGELKLRVEINSNDELDKVGNAFNDMVAGLLQKRHISRFVSTSLVKSNWQREQESEKANASCMTILAADLRGFTSISEQYPPETIVSLLNEYFTLMETEIKSEGGVIYRFIGDAIVAVFSQKVNSEAALMACRAAFKMRARLAEFNLDQKNRGQICVENGVGISSGQVLSTSVGKIGSRRDFLFVGEPVELAEKLEAMSKNGSYSRIIVDKATAEWVSETFLMQPMMSDSIRDCFEMVRQKDTDENN